MLGQSTVLETSSVEPITLVEAKSHLKVDFSDDDVLIGTLISAARTHCEAYLGFALIEQTRRVTYDCFGPFTMSGPLTTMTSVKYMNSEGVLTTIDPSLYQYTSGRTLQVFPAVNTAWPTDIAPQPGAVVIEYVCGDETPKNVKTAMLLLLTSWYEDRSDNVRRYPTTSRKLLDLEREPIF